MSDYLKFTILGEDQFSPAFDKLRGHLPSLKTAAIATGAGLAALGASLVAITKSTANAYDEIRDLSNRLGISTEALSKYKYAASLSGVEMEKLALVFQTTTKNIQDATKGSGAAYDALNRLGVSIKEIKDQTPDKQFEAIADKLSKVQSASQKTALAMDLFGARGTAVLQMLDQGTEGLEEMKKEAEALGLVISTQAAANADAFNDSLTRMQGVLTGVKNKIGEELMPTMTGFINAVSDWAIENREKIVQWAEAFLKGLAAVAEKGVYVAALLIDSWRGIRETIDLIKLGALGIQESLTWAGLKSIQVLKLIEKIKNLGFETSFTQYLDSLEGSFNVSLDVINEQIENTKKNLNDLIDTPLMITQADEMVKGIKAAMSKLRESGTAKGGSSAAAAMVGTPEDVKAAFDLIGPVVDERYEEQYKKQQDALDALHKLRLETVESDINQLDAWYNEQYKMFEDNKDALAELDEIYGEKSDELMEEKLEKEQELFDALQSIHDEYFLSEGAKLDLWYANEQIKYQGNQEALFKLDLVYKAKKQALDKADRAKSLVIASEFFSNMSAIAAAFGKKGAGIAKGFAIAETIINTYKAATGAYSAMASIPYVGPALGIAAAAAAIAAGLANVQKIRSSKIEGIAHGGLTSVPKESTYLLDKGERVLSPNQNRDLTRALQGGMGGTLNQTNHFHILENATGADVLFSMSASKWKDLTYEKIVPALKQAQAAGVY